MMSTEQQPAPLSARECRTIEAAAGPLYRRGGWIKFISVLFYIVAAMAFICTAIFPIVFLIAAVAGGSAEGMIIMLPIAALYLGIGLLYHWFGKKLWRAAEQFRVAIFNRDPRSLIQGTALLGRFFFGVGVCALIGLILNLVIIVIFVALPAILAIGHH